MTGLPAVVQAVLGLELGSGIDVAETVTAGDPIVALGSGPFAAVAAAESSANPIERG